MTADSTNLIIVESPSKARTLKRYLGDNYQIEASVGHIRDLPKSDLGVDVDNGFKPTYVASKDKSKVISLLKSLGGNLVDRFTSRSNSLQRLKENLLSLDGDRAGSVTTQGLQRR